MIKLVLRHLRGPAVLCAILAPLWMLLEVFADLQQPALMAEIIDTGVASGDLEYVLHIGLYMILYALLGLIGGAGCSILATYASTQMAKELRVTLFAKIQSLSFAEIDKLETSSLITRMTNDVAQVQQFLQMMLRAMIRAPFLCIGGIVMAFLLSPQLALILCVSLPVLVIFVFLIITRSIPLYTRVQQQLDGVNTVMRENLLGIRVVKAFTMEPQQFERFSDVNNSLRQSSTRAQSTTLLMMPLVTLVMNLSVVAVLWFGGNMAVNDLLPAGKIMAFVNYMVQIGNSLAMLAGNLVNISRATASVERIQLVLDTQPSIREPEHPERPQGIDIRFENVDFCYEQGECAVRRLSVAIPQGRKVGIIGATGSGKSTLVSLIARLYDVTGGRLTIGGVDVRDISLPLLRKKVGIVLQESLLFSGTVGENLRYGDENAGETQLWAAAVAAQAEPFLSELPDGLDSRVEQRGRNFSGGQKQRLNITRTLVQKPEILILDDSASALDLATEARLRHAVSDWIGDGTLIIITQRISSIMDCDDILVLDDGYLVAEGTHRQLLDSSEIYRSIAVSQLGQEVLDRG